MQWCVKCTILKLHVCSVTPKYSSQLMLFTDKDTFWEIRPWATELRSRPLELIIVCVCLCVHTCSAERTIVDVCFRILWSSSRRDGKTRWLAFLPACTSPSRWTTAASDRVLTTTSIRPVQQKKGPPWEGYVWNTTCLSTTWVQLSA